MKIAVLMKDGFEELEALGIVDIARRHKVQCDMIGFDKTFAKGSHGVEMKVDLDISQIDDSYDALVLPGGPASWDLKDDPRVINLLKWYDQNEKIIGALCAAPIALEEAGIIAGKKITSYPTVKEELSSSDYQFAVTQVDGRIVTGNGPAATFAFAFAVLERLGIKTDKVKEGLQYNYLMQSK